MSELYDWWPQSRLPPSVKSDTLANPCGNIPKYHFSDEFASITEVNYQEPLPIDTSAIYGKHEEDKFVLNKDIVARGGYWTNILDPHLIVWYQTETLSDFKKLYGKVTGTLKPENKYEIKIRLMFNNAAIDTNKYLIFAETGKYGGNNTVQGWIYVGSAIYFTLLLLVIMIGGLIKNTVTKRHRDENDT